MDRGTPFYPPRQRLKAIKCDRQPSCQHCLTGKVPCTRARPRAVRRPNGHALRRLEHHDAISRETTYPTEQLPVELSARSTTAETVQAKLADYQHPAHTETAPSCRTTALQHTSSGYQDSVCSVSTGEASDFLNQELHHNQHLSPDRVSVLLSALALVRRFAEASQTTSTHHDITLGSGSSSNTDIPRELFYMVLDDHGNSNDNHPYYNWPDHLPLSVLEKFCMALDQGTVSDHVAHHYRLCVLSKATAYTSRRLRFCRPGFMADSLEQSRKRYTAAALQCLRTADFISFPSLVTVQSLLAGATLVLLLGNASHAWNLTAFASRLLTALGYHNTSQEVLESEDSYEARHCIFWCYYMDKTLSMLLLRPPSLPALSSDPAALVVLDPDIPLTLQVKIMVKLARIQDTAISLLTRHPKADDVQLSATAADLEPQLFNIYEEIKQDRLKSPKTLEFQLEWDSINFVFFSILTNIARLDQSSLQRPVRREECLLYARKALLSMRSLQTAIIKSTRNTTDFLTWTVLLYPLTPFFVVFCNVVATSNAYDLELLEEVVAATSGIKEQCSVGMNIHELFYQFVHLCTQLPDCCKTRPSRQANLPHAKRHTREPELSSSSAPTLPPPSSDLWGDLILQEPLYTSSTGSLPLPSLQSPAPGSLPTRTATPGQENSAWGDNLMWELFDMRPSVEWFDMNFGDSASAA